MNRVFFLIFSALFLNIGTHASLKRTTRLTPYAKQYAKRYISKIKTPQLRTIGKKLYSIPKRQSQISSKTLGTSNKYPAYQKWYSIKKVSDMQTYQEQLRDQLNRAIARGDRFNVQILLSRLVDSDPSYLPLSQRPLGYALKNNQLGIAQLLVKQGANITARDKDGRTYLHELIYSGNPIHENTLAFLKINGVNINAIDNQGFTALDIAEKKGLTDTARLLREYPGPQEAKEESIPSDLIFWL